MQEKAPLLFAKNRKNNRGYVERCNQPAVHRLITFGSPHGGKQSFLFSKNEIPGKSKNETFFFSPYRCIRHSKLYESK